MSPTAQAIQVTISALVVPPSSGFWATTATA